MLITGINNYNIVFTVTTHIVDKYLCLFLSLLQLLPKGQFEYSIDTDSEGADYFYVHPITGAMSITMSLSSDSRESYILNILATDKGTPAQIGRATVAVTVVRNEYCPVFQLSSLTYEVSPLFLLSIMLAACQHNFF